MSNGIYTPFFDATCEVFRLLLDLEATAQNCETEQPTDGVDHLSIQVGIVGDCSGEIIYRFPKNASLEMVKIMSGMEIDEIDEFVTSAMSEIANIISGNAVTGLTNQKLSCDITTPQVLPGNWQPDSASVSTNVKTDVGDVEIFIRLM